MNDPSTELVHTEDCGQVSINISKPGITKGQHWHNSKWELFIVVAGHGLIQERNINTGKMVEFEVSGGKIEAIVESILLIRHPPTTEAGQNSISEKLCTNLASGKK